MTVQDQEHKMSGSTRPLNILLTGGARGIGRGLFRHFRSKGHRIYMIDSNRSEYDHVTSSINSEQEKQATLTSLCDLRDPSGISAVVERAREFFNGKLDVLINNAAHTSSVGGEHPSKLSLDTWNAALQTNLTAPMLLTQGCYDMLKAGDGGTVINISSTRAHQSEPNSEPYAATKAGLIGLTHALAVSFAGVGITVNAILPGWIHVVNECKEGDEKGVKWEDGLTEQDNNWHLTGRVGRVEDITAAVEYLIGARGVTGTEMVVDGGVTRKIVYPD